MRLTLAAGSAILATYMPFCAPAIHSTEPVEQAQRHIGELWHPPNRSTATVYGRWGPWGEDHAPSPDRVYSFVRLKTHGVSPGMTVTDDEGREWSVKQGVEGQVEVLLSRMLSASGYHQPPVYYMRTFTVRDEHGERTVPGGRFRLKSKDLKEVGSWSFQQNPFVGTRPFDGLLVILLMFESSDLKNSNNSLYEWKHDGRVDRLYVVRDLGTALGESGRLDPKRNDPDLFARQQFIKGVSDGFVQFSYHGWHQELFAHRISVEDVKWACDLMGDVTDEQWREAFDAAGYEAEMAARFIATLKRRIDQGRGVIGASASGSRR